MPTFKKFGKAVFGVEFNKKEQEIIDKCIQQMILDKFVAFEKELDASMLMMLHVTFGFGYNRLMKAWKMTFDYNRKLQKRYEFDPNDSIWLCKKQLKEKLGIDLDELYDKEVRSCELQSNP